MEAAYRAALACLPGMSALSLPRLQGMVGDTRELWKIFQKGGARAEALVGAEKAATFKDACREANPSRVLGELKRRGIRVILPGELGYPERLKEIYDPPLLLFAVGKEPPSQSPYVAVVGSRKASDYGRWAAETLGVELARREVVVVSGAAYGVDGHAHLGCLKAGGFTVAVLGCGVDRVYPSGHARLLARIASRGSMLSEYPPGSEPLPWRFPHRNRIIAGLSHAVVVVEASSKSGALITAELALEEGREVMALPGPINSALCQGTNTLIQKGAKLVSCVEDICEELPREYSLKSKALQRAGVKNGILAVENLSQEELRIIDLLKDGPRNLDWMALKLGEAPPKLLSLLTSMSFKGCLTEDAGGQYRLLEGSNTP
jgi:DNA processing protein